MAHSRQGPLKSQFEVCLRIQEFYVFAKSHPMSPQPHSASPVCRSSCAEMCNANSEMGSGKMLILYQYAYDTMVIWYAMVQRYGDITSIMTSSKESIGIYGMYKKSHNGTGCSEVYSVLQQKFPWERVEHPSCLANASPQQLLAVSRSLCERVQWRQQLESWKVK